MLGKECEAWLFAPGSSTTKDAPQAAVNEDAIGKEILGPNIQKIGLAFNSDEPGDTLAASPPPPPPLRVSGRGAAMVSRVYSWTF